MSAGGPFRNILADADFSACVAACDEILGVKGRDYTQGDGRLKNFTRNAERLGLSAEQVLAIYLFKHMDAIETYLRKGRVESEPIEGRIYDAINYLLLLYKLVQSRHRDDKADAAKATGRP